MIRSSVVLPEPEGPSRANQLARHDRRLTSSSAGTAERLGDVADFNAHCPRRALRWHGRCAFHSTIVLATSVTRASSASSEATAKAAAKLYSL